MLFSCDWLTFTIPCRGLSGARIVLQRLGVGELRDTGQAWRGYSGVALGRLGLRVCHGRVSAEGLELVRVEMPGQFLRTVSLGKLRQLFRYVRGVGGHVGRLDLTQDDLDRVTGVQVAMEALRLHNASTHAKAVHMAGNFNVGESITRGMGFNLGRRCSDSFLRCYDKALEIMARARGEDVQGELEHAGIRWELELKDERATAAAFALADLPLDRWPAAAAGMLAGFVDFRDRSADENITRCPRLDWWEKFMAGCLRARLVVPKAVNTLERKWRWLVRSVAPTLALVVFAAAGDGEARDLLDRLIYEGSGRLTAKQLALLPGG